MNGINKNEKLITQNKETSKNSLNNFSFNKTNMEIKKNNSSLTLSNYKNKKKNIISPKKCYILNNLLEEKRIKEYENKTLYSDSNVKRNNKSYKDSLMNLRNKRNYFQTLFKKHFLGTDIVLPFNSMNDYNSSNIIFNTFNDFNKKIRWSPIKNNSKILTIEKNFFVNKPKQSLSNIKNNKKRNIKTNNGKIIMILNDKKAREHFNKNLELNLYDLIEINSFSNKSLKRHFKKQNNNKSKLNFKDNEINVKNNELVNYSKKEKKFRKKLHINKNFKKNKINNINENYKNQEYDKLKNVNSYKIAHKLIDDPNSFVYMMFNRIKDQKFDEEGNLKKIDLKKRFSEYKKDLDKLEQKARFELFNLKKERAIGNEINMKGRVISTNSFFNLAFGSY